MPPNARTDIPRPSQFGIKDFEELVIPTHDGEKLSAFYIRGPRRGLNANITILMFHGNAGNIGHRLPIARMLVNYIGCNVFMLEYRGYGLSTGEPDVLRRYFWQVTLVSGAGLVALLVQLTTLPSYFCTHTPYPSAWPRSARLPTKVLARPQPSALE